MLKIKNIASVKTSLNAIKISRTKKTSATILILMSIAIITQAAQADSSFTANIGVTTNYVWRGITRSDDGAAVSAGIDYVHTSGWYVGGWASSLDGSNSDGNYELRLYTGYLFKVGPVDLDFGYIDYRYPVGPEPADFGELYIQAGIKNFGVGAFYTVRKEEVEKNKFYNHQDLYLYASMAFEIKKDLYLDLKIGSWDFDDPTITDYNHGLIGLRKGDFSLTFQKNDLEGTDGDTRWSGSWRKIFDL